MGNTVGERLNVLKRRARIAVLQMRGVRTLGALSLALKAEGFHGTSTGLLSADVAAVEEEWKLTYSAIKEVDKSRMLAELDQIKAELWTAWDRSKDLRRRRKSKAGKDTKISTSAKGRKPSAGTLALAEESEEDRGADPRYISLILECDKLAAQLLALIPKERSSIPEGIVKLKAKIEKHDHVHQHLTIPAPDTNLEPFSEAIRVFLTSAGALPVHEIHPEQPVDTNGTQAAPHEADPLPPA